MGSLYGKHNQSLTKLMGQKNRSVPPLWLVVIVILLDGLRMSIFREKSTCLSQEINIT